MRSLCAWLAMLLLLGGCVGSAPPAPPAPGSGSEIDTLQPFEAAARALGRRYGPQRVLLVYDIDNTLLASTVALGSDQWFDWQADGAPGGVPVAPDFNCLLAAQGVLFHLGSMRLTRTGVAATVRRLQDDGFVSLVLTSRGPEFALATHRELRRNRLDFTRQPLPGAAALADIAADAGLPRGTWLPYRAGATPTFSDDEVRRFRLDASGDRPRAVRYEDGVYFTAGQHKGAMLRILLERLKLQNRFDAVVFADDKRRHVDAMGDALQARGVAVAAYHYRAERAAVEAFEADRGRQRSATVGQWCTVAGALSGLRAVFGADNVGAERYDACAAAWLAGCTAAPD